MPCPAANTRQALPRLRTSATACRRLTNTENRAVLGGLPCVAIKAGCCYRQIDPPKRTRTRAPRSAILN